MNQQPALSTRYIERLAQRYPAEHIAELAYNWRLAELAHQPGKQIPYVRLNKGASETPPVLYVPGFTEGIVAKAPFAAELAMNELDVILPDQNRRKVQRNPKGKKDATHAQALNYLSVLESEELTNSPVDVVTHSYGSLIFDDMHKVAETRGWTAFDKAVVIMLAPGGTNENETAWHLGRRFLAMIRSEGKRTPKDFPDEGGEMFKAGRRHALANPGRLAREVWELKTKHVDYERLVSSGLAHMAILGYAEDVLYPEDVYRSAIEKAVSAGVSYATPIELSEWSDGQPRMGIHATHNDEQFNPRRVANAVAEILQLNHS